MAMGTFPPGAYTGRMPDAALLPDPGRCPLCGQSNQCAIEAGQPAESCWCMDTLVKPAALAAVPEAARGMACLCPRCAAGAGTSPDTAVAMPPI
ncbi:cysteine-rich CWC family protein [Paracidovorax avenae]|uniref:cysteine-rich CWC family protein n=2 Tax=Paracidovorax avenae TaxID=80867 RepID=UPI003EB8E051